jgi:hypothetical protein
VRRTSSADRYYFTANQLYLAYARKRMQVTRYVSRRGVLGVAMIIVGLAGWMYALKVDWGLTLVAGIAVTLGGVACVGTGVVTRRDPAARAPVDDWLAQYLTGHALPRLIQGGEFARADASSLPARIDRLLIVERDVVVDLLLANRAEHELSALVLSENGYPEALCAEARRLLAARADLPIIALHDATSTGVALKSRLQNSSLLPLAGRSILDAGLFPADVSQLEELAPAIPAAHTNHVPVDSLSSAALLAGLRGLAQGELLLSARISASALSDELSFK